MVLRCVPPRSPGKSHTLPGDLVFSLWLHSIHLGKPTVFPIDDVASPALQILDLLFVEFGCTFGYRVRG